MENQVNPHSSWRRAIKIVSAFVLLSPAVLNAQQYQQTNLLSNTLMEANAPDANLKNPWGIARGTGAPWWISDNAAGVSTLYNGAGVKQPLTVTIPHTANTTIGSPTGIVFNASSDFDVATGMPADFIFASLDGTISAWNPGVNPTNAIQKVAGSAKSVLTGATIAQIGSKRFLYVADLEKGEITVYDTDFAVVSVDQGAFKDNHVPSGFVPFNVQNIGNNLYVSYGKQDKAKTFVEFGSGLGYVDVFSPDGHFLMQLEHGDWFNAPWGLTLAPSDFGTFSHKVIVGQFGSGEILAFDAVTGKFEGTLNDQNDNVITISGLWSLAFGDGEVNSDPANKPDNALFFTAGPDGQNGLFGTLTPIAADLTQGSDQ